MWWSRWDLSNLRLMDAHAHALQKGAESPMRTRSLRRRLSAAATGVVSDTLSSCRVCKARFYRQRAR